MRDDHRWQENFEDVTINAVWNHIEEGVGRELPWQATQLGDSRCNRSVVVLRVDGVITPLLDPSHANELHARDIFLDHFGGMSFGGLPLHVLALKLLRAYLRHPGGMFPLMALVLRLFWRAGGRLPVIRAVVEPAWDLMEKGITADDPKMRETQELLATCT